MMNKPSQLEPVEGSSKPALKTVSSTLLLLFFASLFTTNAVAQNKWNVKDKGVESPEVAELQATVDEQEEPLEAPLSEQSVEVEAPVDVEEPVANDTLEQQAADIVKESSQQDSEEVSNERVLTQVKPKRPTPTLDSDVLRNLDLQFDKVRKTLETEDAFSPVLGESYFSYGLLLKDVERYDEAREMFVNALHITKVNEGIYSIEQRPILKALFDTHFALGASEKFEENLNRIIWLERQNRTRKDDFTFDMMVKVGNHYIDRFLSRTVAGEGGIEELNKANRYLTFALRRFGDAPLYDKLMPYGELALISYLRSRVQDSFQRTGPSALQNGNSRFRTISPRGQPNFAFNSFGTGEQYQKRYLAKARQDNNTEEAVRALLGLGDINMLFSREDLAAQYYQLAWLDAQNLSADHELRKGFERPVQLPAFRYAHDRQLVERKKASLFIPLTFSVDRFGKAKDVVEIEKDDANSEHFVRAKRAARKLVFRPVIDQGRVVSSEAIQDDIRVFVSRKKPS